MQGSLDNTSQRISCLSPHNELLDRRVQQSITTNQVVGKRKRTLKTIPTNGSLRHNSKECKGEQSSPPLTQISESISMVTRQPLAEITPGIYKNRSRENELTHTQINPRLYENENICLRSQQDENPTPQLHIPLPEAGRLQDPDNSDEEDSYLPDHNTLPRFRRSSAPVPTVWCKILMQLTLLDIEGILNSNEKSLKEYPTMPYPNSTGFHHRTQDVMQNKLLIDELKYDRALLEQQSIENLSKMMVEQRNVYEQVIEAANSKQDDGILVAIHYAGQIRKDQNGNDVFSYSQLAFVRWPNEEIGLEQLKAFILHSIGQSDTKRVQKVYYRYSHEVDGTFCFKRFRLRDDADVALIREWHLHLAVMPLLELYVLLIDEGNNSEANSQSGGVAERNIRRLMLDLNRQPEGSSEGSIPFSNQPVADVVDSHDESVVGDPTTHPYLLNNDSDNDDVNNELAVLPQEEEEDNEEEEEDVQGVN
ncbi:hypothetical protein PIB30_071843 [Stylosanthes scabra]|uniref:Uncharacterized protein n=1 Tax=Stylosanthes scabra TaxID=79078 RepID=A0ABU6SPU4_9FABA|nr:hypothetical protein [Stylosanthes scabra]